MKRIAEILNQTISLKREVLNDKGLLATINDISDEMVRAFSNKNKVLLCGNGGSAADAQHLAAELSGKFYFDRPPLHAEALHTNTSYMTAVANDYSYSETYARLIRAKGTPGDVLIAISTSGNSENIINAVKTANTLGMITGGFTGKNGGKMRGTCKYLINVPSDDTPRIQEIHILIGHIICEIVEDTLFKK